MQGLYGIGTRVARHAAVALLLVAFGASGAQASPDSLRRAIGDVVFGATDVAASPVTGGVATARNLPAVSEHGALQGLYAVPGWVGLTVLHAAQGALRSLVGVVEIIPGLALLPFDADLPEGFNPFRRGEALVDVENPLGDEPAWLAYVLPITPFTIDCRTATLSPWSLYDSPDDDHIGSARAEVARVETTAQADSSP
jgi:hypothetical protein